MTNLAPLKPRISVVIPVYQAEACLDELYRRLCSVLDSLDQNFEIVMVEDCGGDQSWEVIQRLSAADSRVRGLQFSRNFGQHCGITAGLDYCRGDMAVVMDCDLQVVRRRFLGSMRKSSRVTKSFWLTEASGPILLQSEPYLGYFIKYLIIWPN